MQLTRPGRSVGVVAVMMAGIIVVLVIMAFIAYSH
jgi:hypothetical protein